MPFEHVPEIFDRVITADHTRRKAGAEARGAELKNYQTVATTGVIVGGGLLALLSLLLSGKK